TNSATHSKFTGAPAEIEAKVGGAWSAYGGQISGRNIELVEGVRIVQTWRAGTWPAGSHTLVRFALSSDGAGTKLTLDHDAVTDEQVPHLAAGWEKMYWEPLRKFFLA
ncbi:MAG TPA: SRPBCC domain-containing protein, partial [Polyangiaceae bacterium]|nr:SRPBCC domain-containing protein [Polyangiaceae bacterium]